MKTNLFLIAVVVLLSACSGGGGGSSNNITSNPPDQDAPEQDLRTQVCYLGENRDNSACVVTQEINAVQFGYRDPFTDPSFMGTGEKEQYRMPARAVVLSEVSQNFKIAPNFILSEVMSIQRDTFGIYAPIVVQVLQKIRDAASTVVRVNSSFRSPKYNAGIQGAAKWSRHQYGDAFDISSNRFTLRELAQLCKDLGATYTDLYEKHVHCDWRNSSLETGFFGENNKRVGEFDLASHVQEMEESSLIQVDGDVGRSQVITLSSRVDMLEDTEAIYKKWEIQGPRGLKLEYESQECQLLLEKGTYQITHYIGEHVRLKKILHVK